mmetsp:Transcript_13094/g.28856  ORF Transcript_13094/g.28856 Transcript_13094/m.28856 type:complete len:265 (-) Transcript_13094:315-1109(-)
MMRVFILTVFFVVLAAVPAAIAEVIESMECDASGDCKSVPSDEELVVTTEKSESQYAVEDAGDFSENNCEDEDRDCGDTVTLSNTSAPNVCEDDENCESKIEKINLGRNEESIDKPAPPPEIKNEDLFDYSSWDIPPSENEEIEDCINQEDLCDSWASRGECKNNRSFMYEKCPASCNVCIPDYVRSNPDFGALQEIIGNHDQFAKMYNILRKMFFYHRGSDLSTIDCTNTHERCVFWASVDECTNNAGWMRKNCALACSACTN